MANIQAPLKYTVDLDQGAVQAILEKPLATLDSLAHVFSVTVTQGNANIALTGAKCTGYFIRSDKVTIPIDGTVSGNVASVTLLPNCYAVSGRFFLHVKLISGSVVHSILRVEGSVKTSRTDAMASGGGAVQSFDEMVAAVTHVDAEMKKRDRACNLLDNSNFRNPVNQRGMTSNTKSVEYMIDRWKAEAASNVAGLVRIVSGGIVLSPTDSNYCGIYQLLEHYSELSGKTVTLAVCADGVWYTATFEMGATPSGGVLLSNGLRIYSSSASGHVLIRNPAGNAPVTLSCAALYEGSYTDDNVPAYQPKGYAAELAECQRYYYQTWNGVMTSEANPNGILTRQCMTPSRLQNVKLPCTMRVTPTVTFYTSDGKRNTVRNWNISTDEVIDITIAYANNKSFFPASGRQELTPDQWYSFHYAASADL